MYVNNLSCLELNDDLSLIEQFAQATRLGDYNTEIEHPIFTSFVIDNSILTPQQFNKLLDVVERGCDFGNNICYVNLQQGFRFEIRRKSDLVYAVACLQRLLTFINTAHVSVLEF